MIRTITSVTMVIIAGAIFYFYTEPTYNSIQAAQLENSRYDSALNKAAELQTLKQSLLSKYNSLDPSEVSRLQTMLPDQINDIGQILNLDTLAGKYNMSLENVDVSTEGSAAAPGGIATVGASSNLYNTLTMKFTVHGTYATFLQFLSSLETSLSLVDIQSIQMVPSNTSQSLDPNAPRVYGFTVTLQMYWLK